MNILVTGCDGFIGKNLCIALDECNKFNVYRVNRYTSEKDLLSFLSKADFVFHLAGENRPEDDFEFHKGNVDYTNYITNSLEKFGRKVPIVLSSTIQIKNNNLYGKTKLAAEKSIELYSKTTGSLYYIFRFPNIFGKWCRPNYNSFIATFCYNMANGLDISVHDPNAKVNLVYIDDVCKSFIEVLENKPKSGLMEISNVYCSTVGQVAEIISTFKESKDKLIIQRVGTGLTRALYSTYLSYFSPENFSYNIQSYKDDRGIFCEILKTKDSGQFSFFTAYPGITRGGHYHHTKTEKFIVIKGKARFCFRNILTDEKYSKITSHENFEIIETVPGWSHDITNIGNSEMIVMLWANEIFDPEKPDTIESVV